MTSDDQMSPAGLTMSAEDWDDWYRNWHLPFHHEDDEMMDREEGSPLT